MVDAALWIKRSRLGLWPGSLCCVLRGMTLYSLSTSLHPDDAPIGSDV